MNNLKIEQLLDKYFAGETSLSEEKQLKNYFSGNDIAPDLKEYAPLFQYFSHAGEQQVSEDFDDKLFQTIESLDHQDTAVVKPIKTAKIRKLNFKFVSRIAAALLIVLAAWWAYPELVQPKETAAIDWSKYEVKTAEEAYNTTLMALTKTSYEINASAGKVATEMSKTRVKWKHILNYE
jgi:hypothetical protein